MEWEDIEREKQGLLRYWPLLGSGDLCVASLIFAIHGALCPEGSQRDAFFFRPVHTHEL